MFGSRFTSYDGPIEVGSSYGHRVHDHVSVTVTGLREKNGEAVVDYEVHRPWGSEGSQAATEENFRGRFRG